MQRRRHRVPARHCGAPSQPLRPGCQTAEALRSPTARSLVTSRARLCTPCPPARGAHGPHISGVRAAAPVARALLKAQQAPGARWHRKGQRLRDLPRRHATCLRDRAGIPRSLSTWARYRLVKTVTWSGHRRGHGTTGPQSSRTHTCCPGAAHRIRHLYSHIPGQPSHRATCCPLPPGSLASWRKQHYTCRRTVCASVASFQLNVLRGLSPSLPVTSAAAQPGIPLCPGQWGAGSVR